MKKKRTTSLCSECGKSFTEEATLSIHQSRAHDKTSYSCDECDTDVIGKVALNNHKRRHKTPVVRNLQKKNKCDICPYESADKSHVNRHKKQVHEQKPEEVKKSWNCEQCEKKFPLKYGYDRRMKVHKATTTDVENMVKR